MYIVPSSIYVGVCITIVCKQHVLYCVCILYCCYRCVYEWISISPCICFLGSHLLFSPPLKYKYTSIVVLRRHSHRIFCALFCVVRILVLIAGWVCVWVSVSIIIKRLNILERLCLHVYVCGCVFKSEDGCSVVDVGRCHNRI